MFRIRVRMSDRMDDFGNVDHFYKNYYIPCLRQGFAGKAQDKTHQSMERPFSSTDNFSTVLEVGSGLGEHLPFVKHKFESYFQTDIRPLVGTITTHNHQGLIYSEVADVMQLQYGDNKFDRCIATCLLLHLENPEIALRELRRVTKHPGGQITLLVPCEPGILLRIARVMITAKKAKRLGFSGYELFNARDHVTYLPRIDRLIKHVFVADQVNICRRPFRIRSWNFNFYYVYQITIGAF